MTAVLLLLHGGVLLFVAALALWLFGAFTASGHGPNLNGLLAAACALGGFAAGGGAAVGWLFVWAWRFWNA